METVSVIVPTYNRAQRIGPTLRSVLGQDYPSIEILVVDDGSTDDTEAAVQVLAEAPGDGRRVRYVRQQNAGACAARNRGLMLATGRYVLFLDSDDLLREGYLRKQVAALEAAQAQCSICDVECVNDAGVVVVRLTNSLAPHDFIRSLKSPSVSAVLLRRDSIAPGLQWNVALKRLQDIDFMYKYFTTVSRWAYVGEPLFQYCLHAGERISDGYTQGMQYGVLRASFRRFLEANRSILAADPAELRSAYERRLRWHQLVSLAARLTPPPLKRLRKRLLT